MKIILKEIPGLEEPEIEIRYAEKSDEVRAMIQRLQEQNIYILGEKEGREYRIRAVSIHYIETIKKGAFIYTESDVYRSPLRLYQILNQLQGLEFVQISKTCVLNLNMLESIQALKNSQMEAVLESGKKLYVSRTYLSAIRDILYLKGG